MTTFSNKSKNLYFWHIFLIFGTNKFFKKNPALPHTTHGSLTPCRVSEKTNEPIPRKLSDRRMEGQDGQTNPNS